MTRRLPILPAILLSSVFGSAFAAKVTEFSPQGEVAQVRQVRASFSEPVVPAGVPLAAAPFAVDCPEPGTGRWVDARTWTYDFARDLPPGTRCSFALRTGMRSVAGAPLAGAARYAFTTGGPAVVRTVPYAGGGEIDEEQVFVLTLTGAAMEGSVRENTWCEAEHLGERIPTTLVRGSERDQLIKRLRLEASAEKVVMLQCQRRLQNGAKVSLVWGRGIATASGVATTREQRFAYTVRRPFEASFTCERENAHAPCVPVRPLALEFSGLVARSLAEGIRLRTASGILKPRWRPGEEPSGVQRVEFPVPLPESSEATIELPADLRDESGRPLANARAFPLRVRIGAAPPLAKFPGTFGIVEAKGDATLPVTVRNLDLELAGKAPEGLQLASIRAEGDAAVIAWLQKLHGRGFDFERPEGCPQPGEPVGARGRKNTPADCRQGREVSLLAGVPGAERRVLPLPGGGRAFEVVGIPFARPGYYVVEAESPALGAALLGRPASMYVRTSVLVTNLAVHFKRGRDNALVWVTSLDAGRPVRGAEIRVSDCGGVQLWQGRTDGDGVARIPEALAPRGACQPRGPEGWSEPALFVSARAGDDYAFVLSSWNGGIERWRFGVPTAPDGAPGLRAHTVFDRTLLRAGEKVSMKHLIRREALEGLAAVAPEALPDRLRIRHVGSGQEFEQALAWRNGAAVSEYAIPREARLGEYEVTLVRERAAATGGGARPDARGAATAEAAATAVTAEVAVEVEPLALATGSFRVSEFRLPVMEGRLTAPAGAQVAVREVPYEVQLNYVSGGPAGGHELQVSSVLQPREVAFPGYEGFRFGLAERGEREDEEARDRLVADRVAVKLDRNGAGRVTIPDLPALAEARQLRTEASFLDPNGERLTIAASTPLWPATVVVGIRTDGWVSVGRRTGITLVVLDTAGKPVSGVPVQVAAEARVTLSHRRRLVGGFYAYEHRTERKPLGKVCSGKSDARGLVLCEAELAAPGQVVLTAEVRDPQGNAARSDASVWVTEQGEVWFETESQDRMDVLAEKPRYEPGETARLQLRMPFRSATALIAVERDGVIATLVREVNGRNPTVEVPIAAAYGPNVFVSVLAVRGRVREVPWYSLFVWGWRSPLEWWQARREWVEKGTPGTKVDLAKPAFKYGLAELQVGVAAHELKVSVAPARETWRVRDKASVRVSVRTPDGRPAPAGTEVAFAAVDQALLELQPNRSWNLLEAMYRRRGYQVDTATAQMQVIGRRHYGRKAVAAGGGGGRSPARELFDTLLLWNPRVALDAAGEATVEVPINDSLTRFALVALADAGTADFGTGTGSLRVVQDLQILSGLPPVVRSGDAYRAAVTVRNTTARPMRVNLQARAGPADLATQRVEVPAGEAREVGWEVKVPDEGDGSSLAWEIAAAEEGGSAADTLRVTQKREPLVPVTVQQATLLQLTGATSIRVAPPADALPGRGGLAVSLQPSLAAVPPGVRRFFEGYPLVCLEQKVSRAIGLRDRALWQQVVDELPAYLDDDGLARYFPGDRPGSDALTAYVLAVAHESRFALPETLARRMHEGLAAFVEGRIERTSWSPRPDLDVRKLAAIEALSRVGRATPRQLESVAIDPNAWPTGAIVDWMAILSRLPALAGRDSMRARAEQVLRARLDTSGTRLAFSTEADDDWWWLMRNADVDGGRLILAVLDSPAWRDALPKLVRGHLARQVGGRWTTTTANVWGSLALEKFAAAFEKGSVSGRTSAALEGSGGNRAEHDWLAAPAGATLALGWGAASVASPATLRLEHAGTGRPWATVQSLAAVPARAAQAAGFQVTRTLAAVEQREAGRLSRGDIVRVRLEIDARSDMTWVVVSDPVPAGASILGSGLARDSAIATRGEKSSARAWPAFVERRFDVFRAYYEFVPKGRWTVEYTVRLNNEGTFGMPATRVEAMYAPEMFGEIPNATLVVRP